MENSPARVAELIRDHLRLPNTTPDDATWAALEYRTPQAAPLDYARTQTNLGIALWDVGDQKEACKAWAEGEKYHRLMGNIEQADAMLAAIRAEGWAGVSDAEA